ncbi:MAG TPA: SDR family NAD(P)-dependent oxidoreductase [Holophagaceae bacterium]|nr:SDR family NAD(P)-dependent oxidoreductase [Holophagaceae bacterium]
MGAGAYQGRVVLVTGSRRGVGRVISEHFLAGGATVIGFARGTATFEHPRYRHLQVDLADPEAILNAFVTLRRDFPALHILVNNAAALTSQYALVMAPKAAREMVDTNLLAPFLVSREAAKLMRKGGWGRIINVSSMAVSLEPMGDSMYAACKAGLHTLGQILAKEFASFGITVNTLAVSAIETDMLAQLSPDKVREVVAGLPLPRMAQPDDILNVLDFFASERSAYLTAQTLWLGGVH